MNDTEIRDITVIGAGPVGLITSFWAGMREASSRVIDSLPEIGGQLTPLYPEKWIYDVPGYPRVLAKDLVEQIREQSIEQFDVPLYLETTAERVEYEPDPEDSDKQILRIVTDKGDLLTRTIVIAGGHGAFETVTIFHSENEDEVVEVPCDAILLQLGFKTALGPLKDWPLEVEKGSIKVDSVMRTSMEAVWAAGDITIFDGKLKLIATGFAESAIAVAQAVHHIRPETKIQPKYSTNTGVPGAVEGQP